MTLFLEFNGNQLKQELIKDSVRRLGICICNFLYINCLFFSILTHGLTTSMDIDGGMSRSHSTFQYSPRATFAFFIKLAPDDLYDFVSNKRGVVT
jgi:hypothetical protein